MAPGSAWAQTTTLISNLDQDSFDILSASAGSGTHGTNKSAQVFTTGSNAGGYTVSAVVADVISVNNPQPDVGIYTETVSGNPGTLVHSLTNPTTLGTGEQTWTAPANSTLSKDTSYFVVFGGSGLYDLGTALTDDEDAGGASGWSIANGRQKNEGDSQWHPNEFSLRIEIKGAVVSNTDSTAPALNSATVNGATLTLIYNEPLDTDSVPGSSAFSVTVASATAVLANTNPVAVSGSQVTLTLTSAVSVGQAVTLSYTLPGSNPIQDEAGNNAGALANHVVTNATPGVLLSPTALTGDNAVAEGSDGSDGRYTVTLNAEPSGDVTVTIASSNADVMVDTDRYTTGNQNMLTFTPGNWSTAQTVTVRAAEDDDLANDTATLTHALTGASEYDSLTDPTLAVTVIDNDVDGLTFAPAVMTGDNALVEGGARSYTVKLNTQPSGSVIVTITSSNSEVTVDTDGLTDDDQNTLTFTTANWSTAQTVMVRAADDYDSADDTATLTHALTGASEYDNLADPTLAVSVNDNDSDGLTFAPAALTDDNALAEGGNRTYTVKLDTQPSGNVTVTITSSNTDVTVDTDGVSSGDQNTLTFTTTNWSTAQTVTVSAAEDEDSEDDTATLAHTLTGASEYDNLADPNLAVSVTDNDGDGLTFVPSSLTGANALEEGSDRSYTVKLNTQPSGNVTVTITSSNTDVTVDTDGVSSGDQNTLTFTTTNWSIAQTVTVSAAEDDDAADDTVTLTHALTGASEYDSLTDPTLAVSVTDNDVDGLTFVPAALTGANALAEGGDSTYTVKLNTQPSSSVTVTITSSNTDVTVDTDGVSTGDQNTLTFTTTNWSTAQTITVSAAEDEDSEDDTATLTHTLTGASEYDSLSDPTLAVSVTDNDSDGLTFVPAALTGANALAEGGNRTYTVKLDTQPSGNVTVTITSSNTDVTVDTDGVSTGDQNTLTFTTIDWSTAQTVTVRAAEDDDLANDTATLTHALTGASEYDSLTDPTLAVTVIDNDVDGLTFAPAVMTGDNALVEGGARSYTVKLNTQPSGSVIVTITSSNSEVTVDTDGLTDDDQNTLTFTTANWSTAQTVMVRAADDYDSADDTATLTHALTGASEYDNLADPTLAVSVNDNDSDGLTFAPAALTDDNALAEGGNRTYTVKLDTQPSGNVTVTITSSNTDVTVDTDGVSSGDQNTLTFTTTNWSTAQTVTVSAAEDEDSEDDTATLAHTLTGASEYDNLADPNLAVSVTDNDGDGLTFVPSSLTGANALEEGSDRSYTVKLNTQPSGNVTVTITSSNTDVTVDTDGVSSGDQNTLTFTTTNWSIAQTVTVSAAEDDDAADDTVTLTHALTGASEYDSLTDPTLAVSVTDNDVDGLTFVPAALTGANALAEGGDSTYTVKLNTQPSSSVTVTITSSNTDVTVDTDGVSTGDQNTLTFTTIDWSTAQTVTVSAAEDDDLANDTATLTHALTGASEYDSLSNPTLPVTVNDNDSPNSAPAFAFPSGQTSYTFDLAENDDGSMTAVAVGTVTATDADTGDTVRYSIAAGNAGSVFAIGSSNGAITYTGSGENFEGFTSPASAFTLTVRATDGTVDTDATVTISVTDVDSEAPGKPDAPTFGTTTLTSLVVNWLEPANTGPPVTDYDVRYRATGTVVWTAHTHDGTSTIATIGSLQPNTRYDVQVQAKNAEGAGTWSDSGTATTVANSPPAFTFPAGQTSYSFTLEENEDGSTTAIAVGTVSATDADMDTLTYSIAAGDAGDVFAIGGSSGAITYTGNGENHETTSSFSLTVRVADAHNGNAVATVTVTVTDVDEPPSAPAAPSFGTATATSLVVNWTAPANTGPAIEGYDLQYRVGTSGNFTVGPQDVNGTSATIADLTAGTAYQVQVRASNDEGNGAWSDSGVATTATEDGASPVEIPLAGGGTVQVTTDVGVTFVVHSGEDGRIELNFRAPPGSPLDDVRLTLPAGAANVTVTSLAADAPAADADPPEGAEPPANLSQTAVEFTVPMGSRVCLPFDRGAGLPTIYRFDGTRWERDTVTDQRVEGALICGTVTMTSPLAVFYVRSAEALANAATVWLGHFGRTTAIQVLEAVDARMAAKRTAGTELTLGGQPVALDGAAGARDADDAASARDITTWLRLELDSDEEFRREPEGRGMTQRAFLLGSSFSASARDERSGHYALWGHGTVSSFDGREGGLTVNGEVASAFLGADWNRERTTLGLIVGHTIGEGGYASEDGNGKMSVNLTGFYPWMRQELGEMVSVWGVAGYGAGRLTVTPENADGSSQVALRSDLSLTMGAVGLRGTLVEAPEAGGIELAVKTDAMTVRTRSTAVSGAGGNLARAGTEVTRFRLGLKSTRAFRLQDGSAVTPSFEVGVRRDGGDIETGMGVDAGGGIAWSDPARGLSVDLRGRRLLSHEAKGFRESGFSGTLAWDGRPGSARGASLTLSQSVGAQATGGMDALLERGSLAALAANDGGGAGGGTLAGHRFQATFGYGMPAFGDRFTATPELGFVHSDTGRDYGLGWRLTREGRANEPGSLEFLFEAARREAANDNGEDVGPEHTVRVTLQAQF